MADPFALTVGGGARLTDDGALGGLVDRVAVALGGGGHRVAASITFLGIATRLWTVAVAGAIADGAVPDLTGLTWTDDRGSVRLHVPAVRIVDGDPADVVWAQVVDGHLRPLLERTWASYGLAQGLLWGNVASGLVGVATVRPAAAGLVSALRRRAPLDAAMDGPRRRSCCLYYRVPGAGLCGDCGLDAVPGARLGP